MSTWLTSLRSPLLRMGKSVLRQSSGRWAIVWEQTTHGLVSHLRDGWTMARRWSLPSRMRGWEALTSWPVALPSWLSSALKAGWMTARRLIASDLLSLSDPHRRWAMPKPLLALNVLLVGFSAVFFMLVVRAVFAPRPFPPVPVPRPVEIVASPEHGRGPSPRPSAGYDLIAARTLFHPNRLEPTRTGLVVQDVTPPTKPVLYGVVLNDDAGLAYLEDPATKRVFGYKIGDDLAGGRLERIERDRVVIRRADGPVEVFLSGLNKPRPAESAPASGEPNGSVVPMRRIPKD